MVYRYGWNTVNKKNPVKVNLCSETIMIRLVQSSDPISEERDPSKEREPKLRCKVEAGKTVYKGVTNDVET